MKFDRTLRKIYNLNQYLVNKTGGDKMPDVVEFANYISGANPLEYRKRRDSSKPASSDVSKFYA
jgi:hypothetical protein